MFQVWSLLMNVIFVGYSNASGSVVTFRLISWWPLLYRQLESVLLQSFFQLATFLVHVHFVQQPIWLIYYTARFLSGPPNHGSLLKIYMFLNLHWLRWKVFPRPEKWTWTCWQSSLISDIRSVHTVIFFAILFAIELNARQMHFKMEKVEWGINLTVCYIRSVKNTLRGTALDQIPRSYELHNLLTS